MARATTRIMMMVFILDALAAFSLASFSCSASCCRSLMATLLPVS